MNQIGSKGEYSQEELDRIQITLSKVLAQEYISTRPGAGGGRVSYLEGWKALNLANEVFGFNGWSSELKNTTVDYLDEANGRFSMGLSSIVRVTLKDGAFHEDIGYGFIDNAKSKAAAFEKCKKEAFTDGLKRCLRCFGNVLGNCLYDKNLGAKLRNANKENSAINDEDIFKDSELLRMAKKRAERVQVDSISDEKFKQNYKNYQGSSVKPVSVSVDPVGKAPGPIERPSEQVGRAPEPITKAPEPMGRAPEPMTRQTETGQKETSKKLPDIYDEDAFLFSDDVEMDKIDDYEMDMIMGNETKENQPPIETPGPALFVSAKSADLLKKTPTSSEILQFDPKFVSPNIRRTLDPTKSVPVRRSEITNSQTPSKPSKRLIGMPPANRPPLKKIKETEGVNSV